jgi:magnesium-protoporphyrin IX monomethyl ester (oxidative) cyclase
MRVHLASAPPLRRPRYDEWYAGHLPPLGILYLASYLQTRVPGVELAATDGLLRGAECTCDEILTFKPAILGVSIYSAVALGGYALIDRVKNALPETLVVVGGPHATALPSDALTRSAADVVVRGEGEVTLAALVKLYARTGGWPHEELAAIEGIAFRDRDQVVVTPPRPYIEDLDSIPPPARDLLPLSDYRGYYFRRRTPEYPMVFTRGCPYACTFCAEEVWKLTRPVGAFRWRSAENIVDEIQDLHVNFGINEIQDVSDEFNGNVHNALAICQEISRRRLDLSWKTLVRAHPLPEELVAAMAEAGCWQVSIGIESGNQETIDGVGKRFKLDQLMACLELLRKYRIEVQGLFMFYNVWEVNGELRYESTEMSRRTLEFAESLVRRGLLQYTGNFNVATPYPGSELYAIAQRYGLIKAEIANNWDAWLVEEPIVMHLPGIIEREQLRLMKAGSVSITRCLWRRGHIGVRDMPAYALRGVKMLAAELKSRQRPGLRPG